jgi:serine/threonine protein kinase
MSNSPFSPEQWEQIKDLFAEANELPASQRVAFIEQVTAGQPEIRAEVLRLLGHQPDGLAAIDRPLFGIAPIETALRPQSLVPGELLGGRFRVIRLLGRGGMGEVYECEDLQLKTHVAIKTIRPETIGDEKILARFRREIQLSRQVTHPNVCRVFDLLTITRGDGSALDCLTMELLEGETLAAFQRREGKFTEAQALPLLRQMVDALAAAHKANVVHRDLKPSNIILVPQATTPVTYRLVVTDFGLSRSLREGESHPSGSGWGMGTPSYMSPEQVDGTAIERASDIYSLGIILYEMLTGTLPFVGETAIEIALKRLKDRPQPPRERNPQISQRWEKLILRCLELHPQDRFARVEDVLEGLVEVSSTTRLFRLKPSRRRNLIAFGAALFLAIAGWQAYEYYSVPKFSSSAKALYESGLNFIEQGSPLQARLALEQAVREAPDYAIAHARLAEVHLDLDNLDRAKDSVLMASQGKAARLDRERIRAVRSLVVRDHDAAVAVHKQIVMDSPAETRLISLLDLSRSLDLVGDANARRATLEEALKLDPVNPYVLLNLARLDGSQANYELAKKRLSQAEEQFRNRGNSEGVGEILLARVSLAQDSGHSADATAPLEQATALAQSINSPILALRAELESLSLPSSIDQGTAYLDRLRQAQAKATTLGAEAYANSALIDLAFLLYTQGKLTEANAMYLQAIATAEKSKQPRWLALARRSYGGFLNQRRDSNAATILQQALDYFQANHFVSEELKARGDLVNAWFYSDQLERAKSGGEELIRLAQSRNRLVDVAYAHATLGGMGDYQGEFPDCIRHYEESARLGSLLKLESLAKRALQTANSCRRQMGDYEPARQELLKLEVAYAGKNLLLELRAQLELVQIAVDQGRYAEARRALDLVKNRAAQGKIEGLERSLHMATCKLEGEWGDPQKAIPFCQKGVESYRSRPLKGTYIRSLLVLATAQVRAKRFVEAETSAQEALRFSRPLGMVDDLIYGLPILAEALDGLQQADRLSQTKAEWLQIASELQRRWGKEQFRRYLNRPIFAKHWQKLQPNF